MRDERPTLAKLRGERTRSLAKRLAETDLRILDETLICSFIGDNGASAEESLIGAFNQDRRRSAGPEHAGTLDRR